MSQEELGNIPGVTRQSIYKWENDQAVPELDNLLQLSKVFEVTAGWLVNEEIIPFSDGCPGLDASGDTAPSEIHGEKLERGHSHENNRAIYTLLVAVICCAVICGMDLVRLGRKYSDLKTSVDNVVIDSQRQINSVVSAVSDMLARYSCLTASEEVEVKAFNPEKNSITFTVHVQPKEYSSEMKGRVSARCGDDIFTFEAIKNQDHSFFAEISVPLSDSIQLSMEFETDGTSEIVELAEYDGLYSYSFGRYDFQYPIVLSSNGGTDLDRYCEIIRFNQPDFFYFYDLPLPESSPIRVILFEDGAPIAEYRKLETSPEGMPSLNNPAYSVFYFERPSGLTLKKGRSYVEVLTVADEYGRVMEIYETPVTE